MKSSSVLVFGNNEYGIEIAKNVTYKYKDVTIFALDDVQSNVKNDFDFTIKKFDLSDDWDEISDKYDTSKSIVFCTLSDEAKNIFLTISLRSAFKDLTIIALANNNEDANKLRMAGASKVIPIVETTANIITDMLKKPKITEVLHSILYEESQLKLEQIRIEDTSYFNGKYPADIEWSRDHGIIVLSVIHEDMSNEFIYSSKTKHNYIKTGDIFVTVGYYEDLKNFEKLVGAIL